MTAIPIFSIAELEKAYFLGFDAPTLNQYLLFGVADILFIISAVMYLSNAALLYWKESKVSRKYHNTSLFLFGQLSSKLATNTKTMTIICVTLTFSTCLFVIAPVLTGWSLGYLDSRAVYDIQISSRYNDVYEVENLPDTDYGEITAFIEQNKIAIKDDLTFSEYLPKQSDFHQRVKYNFPPLAIALKDYNAVRKMLGYEPIILQTDEFATHWHRAAEDKDIENYIAEHTLLETDAGTLKLSENAVFQEPVGESIYNLYTDVVYIIPDEIAQVLLPVQSNRFVMTQYPLPFKTAEMLEQLGIYQDEPLVKIAHQICRWHHERYDGKGYPDGLVGDEIPISAQVVSVADVYDALASERVYKKAVPHEKVLEMILHGECGQFNPILIECLQEISSRIRSECYDEEQET